MAGANVVIDDTKLQALFKQLLDRVSDLEPVFRGIGDHLLISIPDRMEQQITPEGEFWEPLSELTKSRKTRNKSKILIESGDLMESMVYAVSADEVTFGTNKIYGAMHQFGGVTAANSMFPGKEIPARPWLGISDDDVDAITDIVRRHLTGP